MNTPRLIVASHYSDNPIDVGDLALTDDEIAQLEAGERLVNPDRVPKGKAGSRRRSQERAQKMSVVDPAAAEALGARQKVVVDAIKAIGNPVGRRIEPADVEALRGDLQFMRKLLALAAEDERRRDVNETVSAAQHARRQRRLAIDAELRRRALMS